MEDTTMDETETVCKKGTKSRRSSILKQRTPLQVIEPNPRRVSFAFKQTKEFHSTEAPFVLGSSYEETFQSDSPKCTQESCFTMEMIHSTTTTETYSDRSNENVISCHEEVFNTTRFVNIDNLGRSESEYEARIDIRETETQDFGYGIKKVTTHKYEQESVYQNEQMENVAPEVLDHFMKQQKIQASNQMLHQSGDSLFYREREKALNISECNTSNTKPNVLQHHSSESFTEPFFPGSHIIRNENMWDNELRPYALNTSEGMKFSRSASSVNGNKFTEVTQLDNVGVNKDKLSVDAEMDFTDVMHPHKASGGSDTSHVNNDMDLTKGTFLIGTSSNNDEAQEYSNLDESEIEITNTVGRIAMPESEDVFTKISEVNTLECDTGSINESSDTQKDITNYTHKINAHHLQNSDMVMQSTVKLPTAVDSNKIHTMAATTLEVKKYMLEKPNESSCAESRDAFQMHLCEEEEEIIDRALKFGHEYHREFIDTAGSRAMQEISKINNVNENNSKSITEMFNTNCTFLTDATSQKLVTEMSQISQMESVNVRGCQSFAKVFNDNQPELAGVIRSNSPAEDIDGSQLELTNVAICNQVEKLADISNNAQLNDGTADDSQLEFTNTSGFKIPAKFSGDSDQDLTEVNSYKGIDTHLCEASLKSSNIESGKQNSNEEVECHSTHNVQKNLNEDNLKSSLEVSQHRQVESTNVVSYNPLIEPRNRVWTEFKNVSMPTLESGEDSQLEFTNAAACKLAEKSSISFNKEVFPNVSCMPTLDSAEDSQLEFTNVAACKPAKLASISDNKDAFAKFNSIQTLENAEDSQLEFTNAAACKLAEKSSIYFNKEVFTNVNCMPTLESAEDSQLEFTNVSACKPAELASFSFNKDTLAKLNSIQTLENAEDSQLELTNAAACKPAEIASISLCKKTFPNVSCLPTLEDAEDSQLEFTNVAACKPAETASMSLRKETQCDVSAQTEESQLELTNVKSSDSSMEFTNTLRCKSSVKVSDDSGLEFTNIAGQKQFAKGIDVSHLEITDTKAQNLLAKDKLKFTNFTTEKLPAPDSEGRQLEFSSNAGQQLPAENSDSSNLELITNAKHRLLTKLSDDSQLEFTNIVRQNLAAEDKGINISQLEFTNITKQKSPTKNSGVNHLEITGIINQKPPTKHSAGSELEFTNLTMQKVPTQDVGDSKMEFTESTMQKSLIRDSDDGQLEFTDVKRAMVAKHTDFRLLAFTNITEHTPVVKDIVVSQLDITNIKMQELPAQDSVISNLEFIYNTGQQLSVKDSVNSELKFTNNTSSKSFAEGSDSQLECTSTTHKLTAEDSNDIQLKKFTNNKRPKQPIKDSSDSQMEISNITRQKLSADDTDDSSQLQFTNIIRHRLPGRHSADSDLELISITEHQTIATTASNESQLEFTSTARCIPPSKNLIDVDLEFTACKPTTNVLDVNNCSNEIEAIRHEYSLANNGDMKILNDVKLKTAAHNEQKVEGNCDQTDSQVVSLSAIRLGSTSEIYDESCLNIRETVTGNTDNTSHPSVDRVVEINLDVSRKTFSHSKASTSNESNPYSTQLEITEIVPLRPPVGGNLSCSKTTGEIEQFSSSKVTDGSHLELTNVIGIKAVAESCESTTEIIGTDSAKTVEEDKIYTETTAIMDITNDVWCRRKPESQQELTDIKNQDCSTSYSCMERKENVGESIDLTELSSNLRISRKRNTNDDLYHESNDCVLKCPHRKHFRSEGIADTHFIIKTIKEASGGTRFCKSFNGEHLEVNASTELKKVSSGASECISPASGIPSMNLNKHSCSDSMEFTNKQNYVSQASDSLEFTDGVKYVKDVVRDSLLPEKSQLPSHPKFVETNNSGRFKEISVSCNVQQSNTVVNPHQDEFIHFTAVTDPKLTPKKGEMVRNKPYRTPSANSKKKRVQRKVHKAKDFLDVTVQSDEIFMFDSTTTCLVPSPPKTIQQDDDSENAVLKIVEEVKQNHKKSIEHMQTNLHCELEPTVLAEDELVTLVDAPSYDFDSKDSSYDNLMKSILDADKNLFGSESTSSPATYLSSNSESPAAVNATDHLAEEIHSSLEKPKGILHSSESEIITELERNVSNGHIPKVGVLKHPNAISEIKTEMCHISVDNLLSITGKDVSLVEQEDSSIQEDARKKGVDIEASGREKETVQLPNITLAHTESNCRESIITKDKTEQFKDAVATNTHQSSSVIQKPLSLEEWLRRKHEWEIKELSDAQWSFLFLYKSLGLILKLDAANLKDGTKDINDIFMVSYLTEKSPPETHFVHHTLLKKMSPQTLKTKFKVIADVPELLSMISKEVAEMNLFMRDFIFMETCMLMELKDNRASFKMSDFHIHAVFRVTVDLSNWEDIKPEDVTVDNLMGTINKKEVQNLVYAVPKGPTFLSEYVSIVREYISVLHKK